MPIPDDATAVPSAATEDSRHDRSGEFPDTGRAHELGRTRDRVVIYDEDGNGSEGFITALSGPLEERRVVAGLELESLSRVG